MGAPPQDPEIMLKADAYPADSQVPASYRLAKETEVPVLGLKEIAVSLLVAPAPTRW